MNDDRDHEVRVRAWLERVGPDAPPDRLFEAFESAFAAMWRRAFETLGDVTLVAIVDRVLHAASERYPELASLGVDATGLRSEELRQHAADMDRDQLRFVLVELLMVLGNLTAEILSPALHAELSKLAPDPRIDAMTHQRQDPPDAGELERANRRLALLYEISKLLARFADVEETFPALMATLAQTLPLRTAILALDTARPRTLVWQAAGTDDADLAGARARASATYALLAGPVAAHAVFGDEATPPARADRRRFLMLPLATERNARFGALQIESAERMVEQDLAFVSSVVHQLAVALDRQTAIDAEQAAADARRREAEERQVAAEAARARAERKRTTAEHERIEYQRGRDAALIEREREAHRRASAEALQERYEALVDNLDQAFVWQADARTLQVTYASARVESLLGYPRARWLGEPDFWSTCVHPDDRGVLAEAFSRARTERRAQRCEHRCVTADRRVVWFRTGVHVARDDGPAAQLQGVSVDISPMKQAEEVLRDQLAFTRDVAGSLGEGVVAIDLAGRIKLMNAAAAAMLGSSEGEALGKHMHEIVTIRRCDAAIAMETDLFAIAITEDVPYHSDELWFARPGDAGFAASCTVAPLHRGGRITGAVVAFQDITERKRAEQELHAAVRAREDLLAVVSHDLRSPLAVIQMNVQILRMPELAGGWNARISAIERSADRMQRLIADLLDMASIEGGRLMVDVQRADPSQLVDDALEAASDAAASKSIVLASEVPAHLPAVAADASRVQQVLANLLGNAIKFTSAGGEVVVRAEHTGDRVTFSVTDTGPGIADTDQVHIFERLWQVRDTARLGTGLGLFIVKGVIEAHGGTVWVESKLGHGSTFYFTLALAPSLETDRSQEVWQH